MINNPTKVFVTDSIQEEFSYHLNTKQPIYLFHIYMSELKDHSSDNPFNMTYFANDLEHARFVLKLMLHWYIVMYEQRITFEKRKNSYKDQERKEKIILQYAENLENMKFLLSNLSQFHIEQIDPTKTQIMKVS